MRIAAKRRKRFSQEERRKQSAGWFTHWQHLCRACVFAPFYRRVSGGVLPSPLTLFRPVGALDISLRVLPRATPLADSGLALGCIIAAPLALSRTNHSTVNHSTISALCVLQNSGLKSDLLFNPEGSSYCFSAEIGGEDTQTRNRLKQFAPYPTDTTPNPAEDESRNDCATSLAVFGLSVHPLHIRWEKFAAWTSSSMS